MPRAKLVHDYDPDVINNANYSLSKAEKNKLKADLFCLFERNDFPIEDISQCIMQFRYEGVLLETYPKDADFIKTLEEVEKTADKLKNLISRPDVDKPIDDELNRHTDLNLRTVVSMLNKLQYSLRFCCMEEVTFHPDIFEARDNKLVLIKSTAEIVESMRPAIKAAKTRGGKFEKICRLLFSYARFEIEGIQVDNYIPSDLYPYLKDALE